MYAYSAILNALLLRQKTGLDNRLDISMLESMVEWMGYPMYYAFDGAAHATIYPYRPFLVGDGGTIMLGLQNDREWRVFCEQVLGQPDLANDERFASNSKRAANRDALRALIIEAFATLTWRRCRHAWKPRKSPTPA
jgi:itaconate CoA-transferase